MRLIGFLQGFLCLQFCQFSSVVRFVVVGSVIPYGSEKESYHNSFLYIYILAAYRPLGALFKKGRGGQQHTIFNLWLISFMEDV